MGKINSEDIKNEILFQCNEFKKYKTELKYIDSHQHVHMLPFVFNSIDCIFYIYKFQTN